MQATRSTDQQGAFGRRKRRDIPAVRVIPYDYVAEFPLQGQVGNLVQDVINISVEGVFVAVSIGYGLAQQLGRPLKLLGPEPATLGEVTLKQIPGDLLIEGFRIAPEFASLAVQDRQLNSGLPFEAARNIFQRLKRTEDFGFLLSIVDTASGRELQNEPVHSVASLGGSDGKRPFKMLTQPMVFMPRSTIRLQIEERTADVQGRLFITLQGYKVLGAAGRLEEAVRRLGRFDHLRQIPLYDHRSGQYRRLGEVPDDDLLDPSLVPFDYVSTLNLEGRPGRLVEDEVPVNIDGGYLATAMGYGLDVGDTGVEIVAESIPDRSPPMIEPERGETVDLGTVTLHDIRPAQALLDGIRVHPIRVPFAFDRQGDLNTVPSQMAQRVFQSVNRPQDVRFRYSIIDSGTGRELQNEPVFNVAGLGIADGDRPFKVLHKPMVFLPRSTIRVQVEEIFGRGRLFIVFQGHKLLR